MYSNPRSKKLYIVPGLLMGLILAVAVTSLAEEDELDSDPRAIPYNGILELNGEALNGNADLEFTISDDKAEGDPDKCTFTEEHDNVSAYAGRFAVNIGSVTEGGVDNCVFDADAVYISIGVRDADANSDMDDTNDAYTALSGRQRIRPVPFSYWSAEGSNFRIDGNAAVGGNLEVSGAATVGTDVQIGMNVGNAVLNVQEASNATGQNRPYLRAGQLTIDSEDGSGLLNLVAGASSTLDGKHNYNDTRGASRIRMGDGDLEFYVGDENGIADTEVEWTEVMTANTTDFTVLGDISDTNGDVIIDDALQVTGSASAASVTTNSATINGDLTLTGDISDSNGSVTIDDNLQVDGNITANNATFGATNNTSRSVTVNGDLDIIGNNDITIGSTASNTGDLTVGDRITAHEIRLTGSTNIVTAPDQAGHVDYNTGYNDSWATCGSSASGYKPVVAVRLVRSSNSSNGDLGSDQMLVEVRCAD